METKDFLNLCHFRSMLIALEDRFCRVVASITQVGLYKLNMFMTDSEYFEFEPNTIYMNFAWEKTRLTEALTCFQTMTVSEHKSDKVMAAKFAYSTLHTKYVLEP